MSLQLNEMPTNWNQEATLPNGVSHIVFVLEIMLRNNTRWRNDVSLCLLLSLSFSLCNCVYETENKCLLAL